MANGVNPLGTGTAKIATKLRHKNASPGIVTKKRYKKADGGNREGDPTPLRSFVALSRSASSSRCFASVRPGPKGDSQKPGGSGDDVVVAVRRREIVIIENVFHIQLDVR